MTVKIVSKIVEIMQTFKNRPFLSCVPPDKKSRPLFHHTLPMEKEDTLQLSQVLKKHMCIYTCTYAYCIHSNVSYTVPSESFHTSWLFPHVVLQSGIKMDLTKKIGQQSTQCTLMSKWKTNENKTLCWLHEYSNPLSQYMLESPLAVITAVRALHTWIV